MTEFQKVLATIRLEEAMEAVERARTTMSTKAYNEACAEAKAARHALMSRGG